MVQGIGNMATVHNITLVLVLWIFKAELCISAKILLVPHNINSHVLYFTQLGVGLVNHGHQVTLLTARSSKVLSNTEKHGIRVLRYSGENEQYVTSKEHSGNLVKAAMSRNQLYEMRIIAQQSVKHMIEECKGLFKDVKLLKDLEEHRFSFAIMDGVYPACYYTLPYRLGIPYATYAIPFDTYVSNMPSLSSHIPNMMFTYTDELNFPTRILNFVKDVAIYLSPITMEGDFSSYAPDRSWKSTRELVQNSKLWLYLHDDTITLPRPSMPNTLFIADIMAREANPLPFELESLVSNASNGVILVSFGSVVTSIPSKQIEIIFKAFSSVKQQIIMKRVTGVSTDVPKNVFFMDWLPQNDLLGHPNVKLFITHCGLIGLIEAFNHAKPVLGIPFAADEPFNCYFVEMKGIGRRMKLGSFAADDLIHEIELIMKNDTYRLAIERLSATFKDKLHPAAARISHAINHVLKYDDEHLKSNSFHLNIFQFFMIDIFFTFTVFVAAFLGFISWLFCCFCLPARPLLIFY